MFRCALCFNDWNACPPVEKMRRDSANHDIDVNVSTNTKYDIRTNVSTNINHDKRTKVSYNIENNIH